MLKLREYQNEGLDALRAGFAAGHRSQMLYGPCAYGKTEVAIAMMHAAANNPRGVKRSAMIVDRRILCEQTSARLTKYGIDHGVLMAGSNRWRPELPIQICTAQTLEAREGFPNVDLLIVDEAHCMRESTTEFIKAHPDIKVVGLSGSPFTKGIGQTYTSVASAITISEMVEQGWLINPRVFIAKEIDMLGVKKIAGEWSQKDATTRGIQITGDIVAEWVKKTHEIFGGPRKTIVFCAGVAHGEHLSKSFAEAGYNFISISYKDDDEYKQQVLEEFDKPDTDIHGVIATDILTKGFDQSDVMIGVSARPFSKSFSSHVQQIGRIMRPHEGKMQAVLLDHSGNFLRFRDQWEALYHNGVSELDDGAEKTKPEPTDKEKEASKCPVCGEVWPGNADVCSHCGHVRTRRNDVVEVAGIMKELDTKVKKVVEPSTEEKQEWYSQLLFLEHRWKVKKYFAYALFIKKFNHKPHGYKAVEKPANGAVINWCKSMFIRGRH